jgi:hypothetical protein
VVTAVLHAGRADADRVQLFVAEHLLHAVIGARSILGGRLVGALRDDVADCDQFRQWIGYIDGRMGVADVAHADNCDSKHDILLEGAVWL